MWTQKFASQHLLPTTSSSIIFGSFLLWGFGTGLPSSLRCIKFFWSFLFICFLWSPKFESTGNIVFSGSFANLSNLSPLDITHLASQSELGLLIIVRIYLLMSGFLLSKTQHIKTCFGIFKHQNPQSQSKRFHQVTLKSMQDMQSSSVVGLAHAVSTSNLTSNTPNRGDPDMGRWGDTEGSNSSLKCFCRRLLLDSVF